MSIASELTPAGPASDLSRARLEGSALEECDWCGRPVRRESAFERGRDGDEGDVVLVCAECELGID